MADADLSLGLDAKQLYAELQNVTSKFVQFAQRTEHAGTAVGGGFFNSFKNGFSKVGGFLSSVGGSLRHVLGSVTGALGIGLGVAGIEQQIEKTIQFGAHIEDLSRRFGVSAETLSQWGLAAEKTGTSVDAVAKALGFLEVNREKAIRGGKAQIANFELLGVTMNQLRDPMVRTNDLLNQIGKSSLDPAAFKGIFGKGALEIRTLVAGVADGVIQLNHGLSNIQTAKLKEIEDKFIEMKQTITLAFGPAIIGTFESVSDHLQIFLKNVEVAGVQLNALHNAARTSNPVDFFKELGKGRHETERIEADFAKKQKERQDEREKHNRELAAGKTGFRDFGTLSGAEGGEGEDADEAGGGKHDKLEALRERERKAAREERLEKLPYEQQKADLQKEADFLLGASKSADNEEDRLRTKLQYRDVVKEIAKLEEDHQRDITEEERKRLSDAKAKGPEQRELPKGTIVSHLPGAYSSHGIADYDENGKPLYDHRFGPPGGGLISSGPLYAGSLAHASDADFHADFNKHVDLGPKHLDINERLNRADQLKNATKDLGKDSKNKEEQHLSKMESHLQKIEKNTQDLTANK